MTRKQRNPKPTGRPKVYGPRTSFLARFDMSTLDDMRIEAKARGTSINTEINRRCSRSL